MEKSRRNYQLSHVRTNNQQSHVTTNYQLTNVYINVIEQIVCCIFKLSLFIFTVMVKDIVVVVFAEFLVAWMTRDFQFIIELVSFWYVWRSTKEFLHTCSIVWSVFYFRLDAPFYLHDLVDSYSIWWIVLVINRWLTSSHCFLSKWCLHLHFYTVVRNVCCHIVMTCYVIYDWCLIIEFIATVRHVAKPAMLSCFKIISSNLLWWGGH